MAYTEPKWVDVGDSRVAFSFPCCGEYGWREWRDTCRVTEPHGHILLDTPDGRGRVPFCCQSRAGVRRILQRLGITVSPEEGATILVLDAVRALSPSLTERERENLRGSRKKRQVVKQFMFVS